MLGTQNNMHDEINGMNNAVSCYKEAVQFNVSFVTSLFVSFFDKTAMNFNSIFFVQVTLIKVTNTPLDRSAAY